MIVTQLNGLIMIRATVARRLGGPEPCAHFSAGQ